MREAGVASPAGVSIFTRSRASILSSSKTIGSCWKWSTARWRSSGKACRWQSYRDSSGSAETWFQEPIVRGLVRVSKRAVFLNQRDLLIMRGARPAAGLRWVGDGGAGVRQGGRRPYCGEFGLRVVGRPRLREYGTDFVVDRCQHSCGVAVRGRSGDGARCGAGCWRHSKASVLSRAVRDGASLRVMLLHCYRSISPILYGVCCSGAVPSSWI
jgi:hypothetical protein